MIVIGKVGGENAQGVCHLSIVVDGELHRAFGVTHQGGWTTPISYLAKLGVLGQADAQHLCFKALTLGEKANLPEDPRAVSRSARAIAEWIDIMHKHPFGTKFVEVERDAFGSL